MRQETFLYLCRRIRLDTHVRKHASQKAQAYTASSQVLQNTPRLPGALQGLYGRRVQHLSLLSPHVNKGHRTLDQHAFLLQVALDSSFVHGLLQAK